MARRQPSTLAFAAAVTTHLRAIDTGGVEVQL